jgi:hypothetical protein
MTQNSWDTSMVSATISLGPSDSPSNLAHSHFRNGADFSPTARVGLSLTLHLHSARWLVWSPLRASSDCYSSKWSLQARSLSLQGWGLIDLPLRATFSPAHPLARRDVPLTQARAVRFSPLALRRAARLPFTARIERAPFHRARSASKKGTWPLPPIRLSPRVARAQKIISPHPSSAPRAQEPPQPRSAPSLPPSPLREWPDCRSLRASNEHIPIVRVLRARRTVWPLPLFPSLPASREEQMGRIRYIMWWCPASC